MKQCGNDEQKRTKKKGFLMQEEMEMLDMKRRCEVIQEKLRMLSCIAVNEGSVREIKSVFLEEGKDNNNGNCSSGGEEDDLSDLADELVEVFELDKKGNDNDNDEMGLSGGDKGEALVVNDDNEIITQHDKVIDNNNNITTTNKQQQLHQPILIKEQPSHNIIEITSTQPPLSSFPHFTSSISIVSQLSTTIPANPPKQQQQQQPIQTELPPPDDDTIIKTILETAKINTESSSSSSTLLPQPTQSHTDNPSPVKKKVTFDPTRTFIIEYNENELITHLNVFNADYQPMKYKAKVVKNYKQITKNGVKPCINPEYTKYLKLNVKTMPKFGCNNVVNANKKGNTCNSSRNLSSKKIGGVVKNETFTNIKRNINLNNTSTNTNGKVNKTNNAMNTSMTKQQMKGQNKGNSIRMDKTTNSNVGNVGNSNSSKKVNTNVINKNEHNKDANNNNNNKHKEQNIMTPIYEEDIDNDDDDDNDDIYQLTRRYSL